MSFPPSSREIYAINPLNQVICQLRYPAILAISTTSPAQFQDAIRVKYPWYEEQKGASTLPPIDLPKEVSQLLASAPFSTTTSLPEHHFLIEAKTRRISLTREFIAVTEHQYSRWEDFRNEVKLAEQVLRETYSPAFYNRVGLRYVDVLVRDDFRLSDSPWSELLSPSFIGILGDNDLADDVQELNGESLLRIPDVDNGQVLLKHGLVRIQESNQQAYLIDADFYTNRRSEPDDVFDALDKFNRWAGRLFRWATTEKLRTALGPTQI